MTTKEFANATDHHVEVLTKIRDLLKDNGMSLEGDTIGPFEPNDGKVWLVDDDRNLGNTGWSI